MPATGGKEERGSILVAAGAPQVPGAAILAATAALRAGAGKLKVATAPSMVSTIAVAIPEALVIAFPELARNARSANAVVLGPGMLEERECLDLIRATVEQLDGPILLDAAAITALARETKLLKRCKGAAVLTPHAGEMARLMGVERESVEADPVSYATAAAQKFGAVVALKGAETYIASPRGDLLCNRAGTPGLATSGSGDVLAGVIGGLLARGTPPLAATAWGVFLHARAGAALTRKTGIGFLARELPAEIPPLMRALGKKTHR